MKVALLHDWITGMRGGEKVLELISGFFPQAPIYTLLHVPGSVSPAIESHPIHTSFIQGLPLAKEKYRYYLPFMPMAVESLDLSGYDLIISTSHCVVKGCMKREDAIHLCCCFTPMRYIWDQYDFYFGPGRSSMLSRLAMKTVRPYLQNWDVVSSARVSEYIAISEFIQRRIKRYYRRDSTVIYPPVDTDYYVPGGKAHFPREDYYLIVSALAPYKRVDLGIEAFNRSGKKLKVIGTGQSANDLKAMAKPNIEFLGWQSDESIRNHYQSCRGLIFPGIEDFGIVPLEAQASGAPVLAFGAGGALETIIDQTTGLFFKEPTAQSLLNGLTEFEKINWNPQKIRDQSLKFSKSAFTQKMKSFIEEKSGFRF